MQELDRSYEYHVDDVLEGLLRARDNAQQDAQIAFECIETHEWKTPGELRAIAESFEQKTQSFNELSRVIQASGLGLYLAPECRNN